MVQIVQFGALVLQIIIINLDSLQKYVSKAEIQKDFFFSSFINLPDILLVKKLEIEET